MERTKKQKEEVVEEEVKKDGKLMWKNTSRKSTRLFGYIIKPGQEFPATPEQIPEAFRDFIICIEKKELEYREKEQLKRKITPQEEYKVVHVGGGWWDVINIHSGKPINATKLRKDKANEVLTTLQL